MIEQATRSFAAGWLYTELPLGHILEQNDLRRLQKAILSPIELESLERTHSSRMFREYSRSREVSISTNWKAGRCWSRRSCRSCATCARVGKRLADREKRLLREQKKYEEAEGLHKTAQMLTSSGMKMEQHYESVKVTDYFGDKPKEIRGAAGFDAQLCAKTSTRCSSGIRRLARGRGIVAQQLAEDRNRRARSKNRPERLQAIKDWDTWLAIASKIAESRATAPSRQPSAAGAGAEKRFRTLKIDDSEILIGRSGARK